MHHVPRRCRRRCFMRHPLPSPRRVLRYHYNPRQRGLRRLRLRTYAEQISLDELPANTPAPSWSNSIQFRRLSSPSPPPPPLSRSRFFFLFFSVSLSPDLHDPVSPRRTIDPRLTSFRAVSLNSIYDFSFFSFFPSSLCFLPLFFLLAGERVDHCRLKHDYLRHPVSARSLIYSYFKHRYFLHINLSIFKYMFQFER